MVFVTVVAKKTSEYSSGPRRCFFVIKPHVLLWLVPQHVCFRFPTGSTVHTHRGIQAYLAPSHETNPILLFDALQKINRLHTETRSTLTGCVWCHWTQIQSETSDRLNDREGYQKSGGHCFRQFFELAFILDQNALFRFTHQQQGSLGACRHWC